jgi:hypothetical protein
VLRLLQLAALPLATPPVRYLSPSAQLDTDPQERWQA